MYQAFIDAAAAEKIGAARWERTDARMAVCNRFLSRVESDLLSRTDPDPLSRTFWLRDVWSWCIIERSLEYAEALSGGISSPSTSPA